MGRIVCPVIPHQIISSDSCAFIPHPIFRIFSAIPHARFPIPFYFSFLKTYGPLTAPQTCLPVASNPRSQLVSESSFNSTSDVA